MEQSAREDPRYIARRLFKELCARFPDRYIALIEQPPLPPALTTAEARAPLCLHALSDVNLVRVRLDVELGSDQVRAALERTRRATWHFPLMPAQFAQLTAN